MASICAIKKKPITRNRESLTCIECRARKLKCDRQLPCSSCIKRGEPGLCSYNSTPGKKETAESSRSSRAEARLQHLEHLVEDLVQTSQPESVLSSTSSGIERIEPAQEIGSLYTGPTHHAAMLDDITELRQVLSEQDIELGPVNTIGESSEMDVLFGGANTLSLPSILSTYLPSRSEADRRLAAYFRADGIAAPFLHHSHFCNQYEGFWLNHYSVSPLWISILFSVFHLTRRTGPDVRADTDADPDFSRAAAHCLALGKYNRPQPLAVEAVATYVQVKLCEGLFLSRDLAILMSTLAQVAFLMGYHRDPDHLRGITPFDGEMRRRTWSVCLQLDLLNSFQLGLPNSIQGEGRWDTKIPGNHHDSDLDPGMASLPPPRPDTEVTRILFYNSKHKLMANFEEILNHAIRTHLTGREEELIVLDSRLRETYNSLPAVLHYKKVSQSISDPVMLIVTRRCIELMYQKCLCVLHRKHITSGRVSSIRASYDAACSIVVAFLDMYPEFKPGGQFYNDRWLFSSITWHDFLMGVMTLCLVFCQDRITPVSILSTEDRALMLQYLKSAVKVCDDKSDETPSAKRTGRLLQALLSIAETPDSTGGISPSMTNAPISTNGAPGLSPSELDMLFPEFDTWSNVFESQEWAFLEDYLNTSLESG